MTRDSPSMRRRGRSPTWDESSSRFAAGLGNNPDSMKTEKLAAALARNYRLGADLFLVGGSLGPLGALPRQDGGGQGRRRQEDSQLFSEVVIDIDEEIEEAGGHRVLGRLHSEAPKLPFFTGWVDRKTAVSELRREPSSWRPTPRSPSTTLPTPSLEHFPDQEQEALRPAGGSCSSTSPIRPGSSSKPRSSRMPGLSWRHSTTDGACIFRVGHGSVSGP